MAPDPDDRSRRGDYLAPLGRRKLADEWGYTDIPIGPAKLEPQPLSDDEYEIHVLGRAQTVAQQQAAIEAARLAQSQRLLTAEQRLVRVQHDARSRCMDISSDVRLLRLMLSAGKEARHVERKLGMVERRVYREAA